jgi:polyisoprenoid-binding protein YceI
MAISNKVTRSATVWHIEPASTTVEFGIKVLGLKTVKGG